MPQPTSFLKFTYSTYLVLLFGLVGCQQQEQLQHNGSKTSQSDSIRIWIDQSNAKDISLAAKSAFLEKALKKAYLLPNDSVKSNYFAKLSLGYSHLNDSLRFRKTNQRAIQIAKIVKDSSSLGETYWDLADFLKKNNVPDSSYFYYSESEKIYSRLKDGFISGRLLMYMAKTQSEIGDYTGSEITVIKAIEKFKSLNKLLYLSRAYNLLADNAKLLNEPGRALSHYDESLYYLNKAKVSPFQILSVKHNMALVYQKQGRHEKAIVTFLEVLAVDSIHQKNPRFCGRVLNNLGYSYLKTGQMNKLPSPFLKAQKILDSIGDVRGKSSSALKLAEYYLTQKDSAKALSNLKVAEKLTIEDGNKKELLAVLRILPRVDPKNATKYSQEYIALSDSLQRQERQIRNKFARIRFETDEFIAENQVLAREKQLWTGIAASLILLGLAGYIIINQRVKNKVLKFREEQQANNQEIFNLMLAQGEKVEEGKKMEQKRVSEELHDGVLGKMLGARMMLLGLNKKTDPEAVAERAKAISILQDVEGEVRSISHELSHAAYQKIHNFILSIKDLVQTIQKASKIDIDFKFTNELDWDVLSGEIKINLYRMVQESLQNSVKHAACKNISIEFYADEFLLTVKIADDGKGFVQKRKKRGIGMRNMSSRIRKVNGTWDINSELGKGTTTTFLIPLVSNDNENTQSSSTIKRNLQETH